MLDTSARLLRLLSLLQTHPDRSGGDLARRLGVTPRTVRRDVDRLRELGYPVHSVSGTAGGYRLGAGARLPPLLLADDEAVAVAVGLRGAAGGTVEGVRDASERALAKLEQVLPDRLRRRVAALNEFTVQLTGPHRGPTVEPGTLAELARACRDNERLRFRYESHGGVPSHRLVEPHRLVTTHRRWYLVCWDTERADWRTFRVDRITLTPPHGPRFEPRPAPAEDLAAWVAEGISTRAYPAQATVLLHAPVAVAAERISLATGTLEAVDEHSCLLRTGAASRETLLVHLLLLDFDFEVRGPADLAEQLALLRDRLSRALVSADPEEERR
ncbi:WYL domain-containing protein [Streptomyces sp. NPDC007083]|uniref:helix-turn-helix transcriptional regulator n=1 Tax=Streptomyces sp. NPDC007083 TaxID=3156913 RepID=UPI0033C5326B